MKSQQILIRSLHQAKHLVIIQEKNEGVKMFLSNGLQQNISVELNMIQMLKQFPWQSDEAATGQPADLMFLTSTSLIRGPR